MFELLTPELENSDIAESWTDFIMLVFDRAEIMGQLVPKKMCDNLACSKKDVKDDFRMCSGCKHSYYCSKECQNADWRAGRHKPACLVHRRGAHNLTERHHLTKRNRDFMRALLDHDFRKHKGQIYDQIVKCIKVHPDAGWFIIFDCIGAPLTFKVYSLAEQSPALDMLRKSGPEWDAFVARAERSQGHMMIHVMRAYEDKEGRYWVLPLRSTTGEVYERLKHIAADAVAEVNVPNFATLDISAWDIDTMH
ncbi:hypothetical protein DFH09DRAFT_186434 [Mycena vulgaris]|nr:hypothetical protein DFH09DRAFT_186434 [Mycena vulgaris]